MSENNSSNDEIFFARRTKLIENEGYVNSIRTCYTQDTVTV